MTLAEEVAAAIAEDGWAWVLVGVEGDGLPADAVTARVQESAASSGVPADRTESRLVGWWRAKLLSTNELPGVERARWVRGVEWDRPLGLARWGSGWWAP